MFVWSYSSTHTFTLAPTTLASWRTPNSCSWLRVFFYVLSYFSVDSLTTCFLISFMSFPECHHLSGTSPVTIFKNIHSYTHTYILSVPFLCFISLHSTYCHSAIICFTFLSATPVRTELFMFVYCCIPEY